MSEKQVIMSKVEFDSMEEELTNLRQIVKDKTISIIKTPHLAWNYHSTYVDSYIQQYVFGVEESEVVKTIAEELEKVRKERDENYQQISNLELSNNWLKEEKDKWKNLPWYKRLFIK
jgi:hypothetical protein